jgi:hypothetical protein
MKMRPLKKWGVGRHIHQQMQAVRYRQFDYKLRLASDVACQFALIEN